MHTCNIMIISVALLSIVYYWTTTNAIEQSSDNKKNKPLMTGDDVDVSTKRDGKYFNYLRLRDGECFNCSTYKCTNNKANMGGADWCIMFFPAALTHCDADPNCGGYTMTTAEWFHTKYDKNGQVAVHLVKAGEKPINCSLTQWSSYEKQNTIRNTPVIYGKSTCPDSNNNFNYEFKSNSKVVNNDLPYLCKNHPQNLDDKDLHCILPIVDGVKHCNLDDQCDGFMLETDQDWQKKYSNNGMQAVQLFGKGATFTSSDTSRTFNKQY